MKIAWHSNQISERGTEICLYDMANWAEKLYGYDGIIITKNPAIQPFTNSLAVKKFEDRFGKDRIFYYNDFSEVENILDIENVDLFYLIKAGYNDGLISKKRKTVIHSVFNYLEPHGNVYAYVSEWLAKQNNYNLFVPHMIDLPLGIKEDYREKLNIPKNAVVFGRHGGENQFDVTIAQNCVYDIVRKRDDIYFVFVNTNKFCPAHERIIHLDPIVDLNEKVKFINACDSMIYGRGNGESFGLAIGEFSTLNKPIVCWSGGRDRCHIEILGDKGIYYNDYNQLYQILSNFQPDSTKDWNAYREYTPEKIMKKFKEVFIN